MYYNVSIDDDDGVPHRVKDKVQNILNSPEWAHVSAAAGQRWQSWKDGGWEKVSSDFAALCDIDGSKRAFVDLELTGDASQEEIKEAAHRLRKLYHPDKCSLPPDEWSATQHLLLLLLPLTCSLLVAEDSPLLSTQCH